MPRVSRARKSVDAVLADADEKRRVGAVPQEFFCFFNKRQVVRTAKPRVGRDQQQRGLFFFAVKTGESYG